MRNESKLLIIFLLLISHVIWADDGVEITDPDQVSALLEVQEKIDSLSSSVMNCMDSGKVHKACMCDNEALINEFNTTANKLFELHPELEKLDIVRLKTKDGTSLAQSLSGIKTQANTAPDCP